MSKIPQGEWNAIAARYAQGESISRIAQSYGCTPPAIHYILKRNRQRATHDREPKQNGMPVSPSRSIGQPTERRANPEAVQLARPRSEQNSAPGELREIRAASQPAELHSSRGRENASGRLTSEVHARPVVPQPRAGSAGSFGRRAALTAGLDSDLHGRAEAAIEAFRSSFDAALAEGSSVCRQKLRQAASDLMRVAARTTIVLDRLNANAEHAAVCAADDWGSRHSR
jgi:hypothetical protein